MANSGITCTTKVPWRLSSPVLLLVLLSHFPGSMENPEARWGGTGEGTVHQGGPHVLVQALLRHWETTHHLGESRVPPGGWAPPDGRPLGLSSRENQSCCGPWPPAPHLEDCWERERRFVAATTRDKGGGAPPWAKANDPPWIRGGDKDNAPFTREMQTRIWQHQFPESCSSKRLLVVAWAGGVHGLGSGTHLMTGALKLAMLHNRVLVFQKDSFWRANHEGCKHFGESKSHDCYWHPVASRECTERGQALLRAATKKDPRGRVKSVFQEFYNFSRDSAASILKVHRFIGSPREVVLLKSHIGLYFFMVSGVPPEYAKEAEFLKFGRNSTLTEEHDMRVVEEAVQPFGSKRNFSLEEIRTEKWWRAQATRFLFRQPSVYLCHLINRCRHATYGGHVARKLVHLMNHVRFPYIGPDSLESTLWKDEEPHIPRPIVSMFVRLGDKAKETKIPSPERYMEAAYRIQLHDPNLGTIWLSTASEVGLEAVRRYHDWHVLFANNIKRQGSGDKSSSFKWESKGGFEVATADCFVNIVIGSQCDYFIGMTSSNLYAAVEAMRKTNGRFRKGNIAVDAFFAL